MPITDIGSYPITMQVFIDHWIDVNAFLGGTPATDLELRGSYTLGNFTADRASLDTLITFITTDNTLELAVADRDAKKRDIRTRYTQFRGGVENQLAGTEYEAALPTLPPIGSDEATYIKPFQDMADLWGKINNEATITGFTPPLPLQGGYTQANFTTELAALRAVYQSFGAAEKNLKLARANRDKQMKAAVERIKQYRAAVVSQLAPDDPLLATLPDLTPPAGTGVQAVKLAGVWNAATNKADLSWNASNESAFDHYSVRTSPGPTYNDALETVVSDLPAGTTAFFTNSGLVTPGAMALFKVYVIRTTGAEAGSNVASVTRP